VLAQDRPPVNPGSPPVECRADIKWDRNQPNWPGYLIPNGEDRQQCVPFTANYNPLPEGYKGDYYVDEFTDAKARQAWADCVAKGSSCSDPVRRNANGFAFAPPFSVTGTMSGSVRIYPNAEVNLADIRRPAFFGKAPYSEQIAGAEGRTWTVEVEVPSETFEHQSSEWPATRPGSSAAGTSKDRESTTAGAAGSACSRCWSAAGQSRRWPSMIRSIRST
jgi:hypothetical protein